MAFSRSTAIALSAAIPMLQAALTGVVSRPASAAEAYVLTADEQGYDCKKLTGRMQVRILEIRDYATREKSTMASHGLQTVVTGIFGGPKRGTNPDGEYASDVARLQAYNRQLVAKGCKSFDLEKELQPKPVKETPVPTVAPAGAKKAP